MAVPQQSKTTNPVARRAEWPELPDLSSLAQADKMALDRWYYQLREQLNRALADHASAIEGLRYAAK